MKSSDWYAAGRGGGLPGAAAGAGPGAGPVAVAQAASHSAATPTNPTDPRARRAIMALSYATGSRTRSHYRGQAEHLVDLDLFFLALDPDAPQRARIHEVAHPLVGAVADQDLAGLGIGLEPGREVHAVADDRVLHAVLGAHRARHRLARADSDADRDGLLAVTGPALV